MQSWYKRETLYRAGDSATDTETSLGCKIPGLKRMNTICCCFYRWAKEKVTFKEGFSLFQGRQMVGKPYTGKSLLRACVCTILMLDFISMLSTAQNCARRSSLRFTCCCVDVMPWRAPEAGTRSGTTRQRVMLGTGMMQVGSSLFPSQYYAPDTFHSFSFKLPLIYLER